MVRKSKKKQLLLLGMTRLNLSQTQMNLETKIYQDETKSYIVLMVRSLCDSSVKNLEKPDDEVKSGSKSEGGSSNDENEDEDPQVAYDRLYEESSKLIEVMSKQETKYKARIELLSNEKDSLAIELEEVKSNLKKC